MNALVLFVIVATSLHLTSAATKGKVHIALEQALKNKLHKPWHTTDHPPEEPRKGEYKCKFGNCKMRIPDSEDNQAPVPLDVNWDYIKQ